jgi:hypothetical protein
LPRSPLAKKFDAAYDAVTDKMPPAIAGRIDFLRPRIRKGAGGHFTRQPFNGQRRRQKVVRALYRTIPFTTTLETGTYRARTTMFFAKIAGHPVLSVESSPRLHAFAKLRCRNASNVRLFLGDSRAFLAEHLPQLRGPVFCYLDAHWHADLPLPDEIRAIAESGLSAVIVIDDFEVPDDPGYKFDEYDTGLRLTRELLDGCGIDDWGHFYPRARASKETGGRRGYLVLCSPDLVDDVSTVPGLRPRTIDA